LFNSIYNKREIMQMNDERINEQRRLERKKAILNIETCEVCLSPKDKNNNNLTYYGHYLTYVI